MTLSKNRYPSGVVTKGPVSGASPASGYRSLGRRGQLLDSRARRLRKVAQRYAGCEP